MPRKASRALLRGFVLDYLAEHLAAVVLRSPGAGIHAVENQNARAVDALTLDQVIGECQYRCVAGPLDRYLHGGLELSLLIADASLEVPQIILHLGHALDQIGVFVRGRFIADGEEALQRDVGQGFLKLLFGRCQGDSGRTFLGQCKRRRQRDRQNPSDLHWLIITLQISGRFRRAKQLSGPAACGPRNRPFPGRSRIAAEPVRTRNSSQRIHYCPPLLIPFPTPSRAAAVFTTAGELSRWRLCGWSARFRAGPRGWV